MCAELISPHEMAQEANRLYTNKLYKEAAEQFRMAAEAYKTKGDQTNWAEMMNNASVAYLQAGEPEDALRAVSGTDAVFETSGERKKLAMVYGNRAAALEAMKKYEAALEDYQRSAEILREFGEDDLYLSVMQSISALKLKTGNALGALVSMQSGVEEIKKPSIKQRLLKKLLRLPFDLLNKG